MKGLTSLERVIVESLGKQGLPFEKIQEQTGLQENVCFNLIQALIIKGIISFDKNMYKINPNISPLIIEEINGKDAKREESLELIEAIIEMNSERIYRLQKVALDEKDEKIFKAMLYNLESFLKEANQKSQSTLTLKNKKSVFWGMSDVQKVINQIVVGE
jgi:cyanate lyase